MTTDQGIAPTQSNVIPLSRPDGGPPFDPVRVAFALDANQSLVFWRVSALRAANPDKAVRATDLEGAGPGLSTIQKALAELTAKAPGEPGRLLRSGAEGYRPEFDPSPYLLRGLQIAAECKADPVPEPTKADEKPGEPITVVKAWAKETGDALFPKWRMGLVYGFFFSRPSATKGEIGRAIRWVTSEWRTILKRREFVALKEGEYDDDGFCVRRGCSLPAEPEPKFLGDHAHLFWQAWDSHRLQEAALAANQQQQHENALRYAAWSAEQERVAEQAGLTIEQWFARKAMVIAVREQRERERAKYCELERRILRSVDDWLAREDVPGRVSRIMRWVTPSSPPPPEAAKAAPPPPPDTSWAEGLEPFVPPPPLPSYDEWKKLPIQPVAPKADQEGDGEEV